MKSKKTNPFVITTLIFFMTTVMFGLLTTGVIIKYRKSTVATNTDKLSNDEIEKLKSEEKEDLLSDMKLRFTNGEGSLSILKSYFPDNIVYVNNKNQYVFAQILPELAKNNYKDENFKQDDKGIITYNEDGKVTTHMGVDASKFQGNIDFKKLKEQGVEFAMLRCGFRSYGNGILNTDSSFDTFAKDAIKNNIKIGAYFFSSAITQQEAIEEADYVLDIIKPYKITYPVVIDFEEISGDSYRQENLTTEELTDIIIAFCDKIEKAGYKPMIYSNLKGFVGRLDLTRLEKYEKWFAYYSDTPYFPYEFSIWQYTESAKLDGVSGNTIDLNISFKDYN